MNGQTNWIPGLITLGVGFVLALVGLFVSRRAQARAAAQQGPTASEDTLETRYRGLIAQLKELELDKHQRTPEAYAAERARLEREAADVLRARDQARAAPRPAAAPPRPETGPLAGRPRTRTALWAAAIILFFGGVGYLLASELKGREAGGTMTGATPPGMGQAGGQREDPELAEARQRYEANPADLDAASLITHELIRKGELEESHRIVQRALALDPFNVELRVHKGVLRAATGDVEGARKELEALVDAYPDAQEALLFLGAMSLRDGDRGRALDYFERFQVEVPLQYQPPQLTQAIADLKAQVAQGGGK